VVAVSLKNRHHFREFAVRTDQPAGAVAGDLADEGFAVHVVDEHLLQVCVTDLNADRTDGLVEAFAEVI
jgi:glycine dehydrogenase subunit 1